MRTLSLSIGKLPKVKHGKWFKYKMARRNGPAMYRCVYTDVNSDSYMSFIVYSVRPSWFVVDVDADVR